MTPSKLCLWKQGVCFKEQITARNDSTQTDHMVIRFSQKNTKSNHTISEKDITSLQPQTLPQTEELLNYFRGSGLQLLRSRFFVSLSLK